VNSPRGQRRASSQRRSSTRSSGTTSKCTAKGAAVSIEGGARVPGSNLEISLATLGHAGDFGSLAHYADPAYYDLTYRDRRHDVEYYVSLARACPGRRVLEYGCGNGRITLAMAQAGATVQAVDLSKPMLEDLERRLTRAPASIRRRVQAEHADMRSFSTHERYALVIAPFNTVLHLYEPEELLAFLARVREHLAVGGKFVFDVSLPQAADLCRDPSESLPAPDFTHPETGEVFGYCECFEYDPIRQLLVVWMHFSPKDGGAAFTIPLAHRQYYPQELRSLLGCAGFGQVQFSSDFSAEPAGMYTDSLVVECSV
jgi:SAM-dependent methyltransferase